MSFLTKIGQVPTDEQIFNSNNDDLANEDAGKTTSCRIENVSRRSFLKVSGLASSSLVIGVQLASVQTVSAAKSGSSDFAPDVFISMDKRGTVTIICHRSEMGQGIRSSLPMLVADEMECDWQRVIVEQGLGDAKYGSQNTDGSRSVRRFYTRLKEAGATARTMLQTAAAQVWKVKPTQVEIYNHQAKLKSSSKTLDFSQLVEIAATLPVPDKKTLKLKKESEHRYVGKDTMPNIDGEAIVSGKAIYGFDVELEQMKYAVIARPPVLFGKVKSFDATEALKVPGVVKIVEMPTLTPPAVFKMLGGIAVIAENTWAALQARDKLKITWDHGDNANYNTKKYEQEFVKALKNPPHTARSRGNWEDAKTAADKIISRNYYVAGIAHATMEPPAATARISKDGVDVWTCTQTPQSAQSTAMGVMKIPKEKASSVKINVTLLGGGFGRKSKPDYIAEAVFLANETKMPIKVQWTREDEIKHGYYHSPSYQELSASFDKEQRSTGWYHGMVNHPIGSTFNPAAKEAGAAELGQTDMPFDIPNIKITNGESETSLRIGWVRSVTNINNVFAVSSFADELAVESNKDPKDYLLSLIGKDQFIDLAKDKAKYSNYGESNEQYPIDTSRLKNVINVVAKDANWGKKLPKGHGIGIAAHRSFCSYVATVVEVSSREGKIQIEKVYYAVDAGKVINPDRVRSQMEGAAIFSTSLAYYGEITADKGIVDQSNFHDYELARIGQVPVIEVNIIKNDHPPAGVGEPGVPPFAPALCNAIYNATGKRYRRLPLKQYGIV
ncbi:MAG: molybdopterin-dependent oxidoreductase [Kangiellaceae bacterium]|nr:molybdopterin-dependent oxidoreductase [Kangiellaceae bacterium]